MTHAHFMLDIYCCKHTLRKRNIYCYARQQWLHERASVLRRTYIACVVLCNHRNHKPTL